MTDSSEIIKALNRIGDQLEQQNKNLEQLNSNVEILAMSREVDDALITIAEHMAVIAQSPGRSA